MECDPGELRRDNSALRTARDRLESEHLCFFNETNVQLMEQSSDSATMKQLTNEKAKCQEDIEKWLVNDLFLLWCEKKRLHPSLQVREEGISRLPSRS